MYAAFSAASLARPCHAGLLASGTDGNPVLTPVRTPLHDYAQLFPWYVDHTSGLPLRAWLWQYWPYFTCWHWHAQFRPHRVKTVILEGIRVLRMQGAALCATEVGAGELGAGQQGQQGTSMWFVPPAVLLKHHHTEKQRVSVAWQEQ